jgi:hypothetical protein
MLLVVIVLLLLEGSSVGIAWLIPTHGWLIPTHESGIELSAGFAIISYKEG